MREQKYRVWDKTREEFLSAGTISINIHRGRNPEITISLDKIMDITKDHRFIIMQYIGFQDANKKDIYEGDILKSKDGKVNVVVWYDKLSGYILGSWLKEGKQKDIDIETLQEKIIDCAYFIGDEDEIIGNIYENPELLER